MPRISAAEMEKRTEAIQAIMEEHDYLLNGITINELIEVLKKNGVKLPKNKYQAVYIVLKNGEKQNVVECKDGKWRLLEEEEV